jgi:hypothetical protein
MVIKNGQSGDTDNNGHTRHRTKTNKARNRIKKNTNPENFKDDNTLIA